MSASAPAVTAKLTFPSRFSRLLGTSIGLKLVMAVTGVALSGFVMMHMLGNLLAYQSPAALDAYGAALRKFPAALWGARLGLLLAAVLHIVAFLKLDNRSSAARPEGYKVSAYRESTLASRTMRWTGPLLLAFIVFHLADLTLGYVNPGFVEGEVYRNLRASLLRPAVGAFYLVAMAALAFHLYHGIWSMFQTIGCHQPRYASFGRKVAAVFTFVVAGGFAAVPIGIILGLLR